MPKIDQKKNFDEIDAMTFIANESRVEGSRQPIRKLKYQNTNQVIV